MEFTTLLRGTLLRTVTALTTISAASATAMAKEVNFSYSDPKDAVCTIGTVKAEVYDVAIILQDPILKGAKIVGIELPIAESPNITDYSAWISTELNLEADEQGKKHNAPDYCTVAATPAGGMLTARFDNPYIIGDKPVYVGYSFKVAALGESENDVTRYPVTVTSGYHEGGLFLHTERHYRQWADRGADLGGISTIKVILEGDFADNSAALESLEDVKCQQDQSTITLPVVMRSYGAQPVSSLDFTYTYQGKTSEAHLDFAKPLNPLFGQGMVVNVDIPNTYELGTEPITMTLSKINGQPNENELNTTQFNLSVLRLFPKKRPVVEEYTGLWCGWCPRGYVGMETMAKEQPDFIGIAFHNGDPMQAVEEYPSKVSGYPSCVIDRDGTQLSPSVSVLREKWARKSKDYSPVELNVVAYREEGNPDNIHATSTFRFVEQPAHDCLMTYILVANGLKDDKWGQTNYFYNRYEQYMDDFYGAKNPIFGLTFNDVAVMVSPYSGEKWSVPAASKIEPYAAMNHYYTFETAGQTGTTGYDLIRAAGENLEVVALMIDTVTGEIINAAKTGINLAGVETVTASAKTIVAEIYYDLNGIAHSAPGKGLYIKRVIFEDGSCQNSKVMIK